MKHIHTKKGEVIIVDDADYKTLAGRWWLVRNGYAITRLYERGTNGKRGRRKQVLMHRIITGAKDDEQVDHINFNTLDNRRSNLRICSHAENVRHRRKQKNNTSGYTGVSRKKENGLWQARIKLNGKSIFLGYSKTPEGAYEKYVAASAVLHNKFSAHIAAPTPR